MPRSFAARLAISYMLLLLLSLVVLGGALGTQSEAEQESQLRTRLLGDARALAVMAAPLLAQHAPLTDTQALAQTMGASFAARVTLVTPDGKVWGDSAANPLTMENHAARPEVIVALSGPGAVGENARTSATVQTDLYYLAVPILDPAQATRIIGVARVALSRASIEQARVAVWTNLLWTALGISLLALALAVWVARTISRPVTELRQVARRIGMGDLGARAHTDVSGEIGELAQEVNVMAERLEDTVRRRTTERNEMAAVLAHMHDGIIITNVDGIITAINPSAARLLGLPPENALHRSFIQVARDYELHAALHACLDQPGSTHRVEVMLGPTRLAATLIAVPATDRIGVTGLVVLQDVTELRYLERVRRDFVANISHELRTPLAAIKLLVETLESVVQEDPDAAQQFLHRIEVELDDMTQLVRELLELSRIESGEVRLQMQDVTVESLLNSVAERLAPMAERKHVALEIEPPDLDLPLVHADPTRIDQVLLNLVHNAIKFTPPAGRVTLRAMQQDGAIAICVIDTGIGIAPEDLPRVFERFYKADKARAAGSEGGTGLGLAIAKHLVRAHGGQIWAESTLDAGSTFCFSLPATKE